MDIKFINRMLYQRKIKRSYYRLDSIISVGIISFVIILVPIIVEMVI